MKRKKIWLITIGALAIIVGFFIYIIFFFESPQEEWVEIGPKFEEPQNYELQETEEGTFLVNKHAGFSLKVPDGWKVEKVKTGVDQWIVNLLSPDAILENSQLQQGCGVSVWVEYDERKYQDLLNTRENPTSSPLNMRYSTVTIGGILSVQKEAEGKLGKVVIIETPFRANSIFHGGTFILSDYPNCEDYYNQILQTVNFSEV